MVFGQDSLTNVEFQGKLNKTKTFGRLNWPIVSVSNLPSIFIGRKKIDIKCSEIFILTAI